MGPVRMKMIVRCPAQIMKPVYKHLKMQRMTLAVKIASISRIEIAGTSVANTEGMFKCLTIQGILRKK